MTPASGRSGSGTCPECGYLVLAGYERHVERCRETPDGKRAKP